MLAQLRIGGGIVGGPAKKGELERPEKIAWARSHCVGGYAVGLLDSSDVAR